MRILKLIKPSEVRLLLVSLVVLVLLAAAMNVPFAITKMRSRSTPVGMKWEQHEGADAAARGWPVSTPHRRVWDAPESWSRWSGFGYEEFHVSSPTPAPGVNGFSMQVQRLGWPLAVVEIRQMWWDWNDPALDGPEPDPRPQLVPTGLVLNPLMMGGGLWLVLCVLPMAVRVARRVVRRRRGRCAWCGFEVQALAVCPECGVARGGV
jgi:hypothetical protein